MRHPHRPDRSKQEVYPSLAPEFSPEASREDDAPPASHRTQRRRHRTAFPCRLTVPQPVQITARRQGEEQAVEERNVHHD